LVSDATGLDRQVAAKLRLEAEQRQHDLREVFSALRWLLRSGALAPHRPAA
jgi:hypothetical protein